MKITTFEIIIRFILVMICVSLLILVFTNFNILTSLIVDILISPMIFGILLPSDDSDYGTGFL